MKRGAFFKLVFFVFAVMIAVTKLTDADLSDQEDVRQNVFTASTLDFANQDTANNFAKSLLFNVSGLVPGGFQVESVRVSNQGELSFTYQLTTENFAGDGVLCSALDLMVLKDWQVKYDGKLNQVNFEDQFTEDKRTQDLVLVLKLTAADAVLAGKTCAFDIKIKSKDDPDGSAFSDEEVLTNSVTTAATW